MEHAKPDRSYGRGGGGGGGRDRRDHGRRDGGSRDRFGSRWSIKAD